MKLDAYDVQIVISDPEDPATKITLDIKNAKRDALLQGRLSLAASVLTLEQTS